MKLRARAPYVTRCGHLRVIGKRRRVKRQMDMRMKKRPEELLSGVVGETSKDCETH